MPHFTGAEALALHETLIEMIVNLPQREHGDAALLDMPLLEVILRHVIMADQEGRHISAWPSMTIAAYELTLSWLEVRGIDINERITH